MDTTDGPPANESTSFPVNPVEESLDRALTQAERDQEDDGPIGAFISALREGDLWVPLPEGSGQQDDGSVALPTLELEGSQFIPVFTSEAQLSVRSAELPFTVIAARDLAGLVPQGVGLALNPGNTASVPLYPDAVATLASG